MLSQFVGGNYSYGKAWRHLLTVGSKRDGQALEAHLSEVYQGEAVVYSKGRSALAEGVRLVTGGSGKVVVNGLTCYSVVQAVRAAGCEVVYVDVDKSSLNLDVEELEKALHANKDIKAVIVQNTLGIPCDIEAIQVVTKKNEVEIIEDLAHSAGVTYKNGIEVGKMGAVTMLSFGRNKSADAMNGGALVVRDKKLASKINRPTQSPSWFNSLRDRKSPLVILFARSTFGFGLGKLILAFAYKTKLLVRSADGEVNLDEKLPNWQAKRALEELYELESRRLVRRTNTQAYVDKLPSTAIPSSVAGGGNLVRFPVLVKDRTKALSKLRARGFYLDDIWYDVPVIPTRFYGLTSYDEASCPTATGMAKNLVNLPTHENVTLEHIDEIVGLLQGETL